MYILRFQQCVYIYSHEDIRPCDAKRKRWGALDSCFGLVGPHQQSIRNFSLWHHEFIKATRKAALVVLKCESINVPKYVIQPADITRVGSLCYWPPVPQNGRKTLL